MDCIRVNSKNVGLRYVSLYMNQNVIYTAGKSFSVVMWPDLQMKDSWSVNLTFRAHNRPFYSCLLGNPAFGWQRGWC